ncbi:MAG TPA: CDP-alcohol phosphatidyltransferase family protein [Candidatus Pacearchaeota archaeon]|nr:CDP-alcohol phosphatidyltransferase family protein [Candidatus Pacearchaeota archaeon]HOL90202.1 CDP-alcohol phosphatidyltransferase family protein [Candidatus Pacearchaeota archaeon]HPO68302.1 CDP-alcohol phosphatidyltransferase family protein [Candidatus Pacearchaeota archaeon]
MEKENIFNIPNALTLIRILITFPLIYLIFTDASILYIALIFIIGMLTDFFDGFIARNFNLKTEFGRKFDMFADRVLMIGTAVSFLIKLFISKKLIKEQIFQIILILSREIILFPIILIVFILKRKIIFPQVRIIGKATTLFQSISFPLVLLNNYYSFLSFSVYFAIFTGILGLISSFYYTKDIIKEIKNLKTIE